MSWSQSLKSDRFILIVCVAVLVVGLVLGYFHRVGNFGVETDFYEVYAIQAENIIAGRPYTYQHNPPGYTILLAAIALLTGDMFVAGKIISALATALFGWITYLLLKAVFNSQIAFICTILSLLILLPSSFIVATDIVSAVVILLGLRIFLRQPVLTVKTSFLAGIVAGLAYLIRGNAIFLGIGMVISVIAIWQATWRKRLIWMLAIVAGIFLVTLPWFVYSWKVNSSAFNSSAYLQIAANFYHPESDEFITAVNEMRTQFSSLTEVFLYDPPRIVSKYLQDVFLLNIPRLFVPKSILETLKFPLYQLAIAPPLLLVIAGLIFLIKDSWTTADTRKQSFVLINLLGYLLLGLVGFHRRYYFFLFPAVWLAIAYPFLRRSILSIHRRTLIIVLISLLTVAAGVETNLNLANEPRYLIEIATFLKIQTSPNEIIITRKPHLAYLAGLNRYFPLAKNAEEYLVKAREHKASYLVYSDYEASIWPGLKSFKNPQTVSPNFKLIYQHQSSQTLIYKID
jgi:4-amino-4-deoxy-L-arabinose transferase-like glycosyltransferase